MSRQNHKKGKTYYRLGTRASAGLLVASVCIPAIQGTVHAEELTKTSTNSERRQVSSATIGEKTVQDVSQSTTNTSDSTITNPETGTTENTGNSTTVIPPTTENGGSSSSENNSTTPQPSKPKPQPQPSVPALPHSEKPAAKKPAKKKKDDKKKEEKNKVEDGVISYSKNQSTTEFIEEIGNDASKIAAEHNLYASVMIAQAILESGSGNSSLASKPNYNIFGIKGSYQGKSVSMATLEDDGKGKMFSISANFRKYPSYKESLQDYAKVLTGGTDMGPSFYQGAWKNQTASYRDATAYLTGRYATDTKYNQKLNGLIETYDLQRFDDVVKVKKKFQVTRHKVSEGETLWDLAKRYGTTVAKIKSFNKLKDGHIQLKANQELIVKRKEVGQPSVQSPTTDAVNQKAMLEQQKQAEKAKAKEKEEKELALLKVSQIGHSITKAVPTALYESHEYKVVGKQVKTNKTYYVAKNDTLKSISKKIGVPVDRLVKWNNLEDSILTEGQVLVTVSPFTDKLE